VRPDVPQTSIRWHVVSLIRYARCADIIISGSMPHLKNRLRQQPAAGTGMFSSNGGGLSIHQFCSLRDGGLRFRAGSSWFQLRAVGYHPVLQVAPQRDREAPCDRDDRDASRAAVCSRALGALVEPLR